MSENVSPRPWKADNKGFVVDNKDDVICLVSKDDAQYIVKAVNEHDSLVAEVKNEQLFMILIFITVAGMVMGWGIAILLFG